MEFMFFNDEKEKAGFSIKNIKSDCEFGKNGLNSKSAL